LSSSVATDTGERPLRADARRNRARVMEVARAAFAECGSDLPMEELARRAGVGVGTVYRHFPNKEMLLDALLAEQLETLIETTRAALAGDDAWEAFRGLVRNGAAMQADDMAFCEVVMARKQESGDARVAQLRDELDAAMGELIGRAQASGAMRKDFRTDDVGVLFASIAGAIRSSAGPDAWKRQVEFALDGLRA
jgi:AcrR family transcriptional regulator